IFLALTVSPTTFGRYYEVVAIVAILTTLGTFGLDVGVVRWTAAYVALGRIGSIRGVLWAATSTAAIVSIALAFLMAVAAPQLASRLHGDGSFVTAIRIAAVAVPLTAIASILVAPAKGFKWMLPSVVAIQIAQPVAQAVLAWLIVPSHRTEAAAALALMGSVAIGAAIAVVWLIALRLPQTGSERAH